MPQKPADFREILSAGIAVLGLLFFAVLLFKHISYPLLWQDEAETAMFGTRIVEYGFPKVHGERNVLYEFGRNVAIGIDEKTDAYIGTTWGHFYLAAAVASWAEATDDIYGKTARMRFPFALAGFLGIIAFFLAAVPCFGSDRWRMFLYGGLFFAMCAASVSLVLHLREARYYALVVLLAGIIFSLHLRWYIYGRIKTPLHYAASMAALLVILFNVFYSAFIGFAALLSLHGLWVSLRRGGEPKAILRSAAWALAPALIAAVLLIPVLIFFETFRIAASFADHYKMGSELYLENLRAIGGHLITHEWLGPAAASRLLVVGLSLTPWAREAFASKAIPRRVSGFFGFFAVGYIAIGCGNPLIYERYFVVLSPVLATIFLLDTFVLVEAAASTTRRWVVVATVVAILAGVAATSGQRIENLRNRFVEISVPMKGPLDFLVPYVLETYPKTEELVIATNYEAHPLMYYLGSRVIVGWGGNNLRAEWDLEPDLVVPRRKWRRGIGELKWFLGRGNFESIRFPVPDLYYNNNPSLSHSRKLRQPHIWRTPPAPKLDKRFVIFRRGDPQRR